METVETKFEVWVRSDGRWVIRKSFADQKKATKYARRLSGSGDYQGVQLIQDKLAADGRSEQKIFFDEDLTLQVELIEDDPVVNGMSVCQTVDEIYDQPSRRVINRLFRDFLIEMVITPTELLYGPSHLAALRVQTHSNSILWFGKNSAGQGEGLKQMWFIYKRPRRWPALFSPNPFGTRPPFALASLQTPCDAQASRRAPRLTKAK